MLIVPQKLCGWARCQQPLVEQYNTLGFTVTLSNTASSACSIHRACPYIPVSAYRIISIVYQPVTY